jgi:hypothetical protein
VSIAGVAFSVPLQRCNPAFMRLSEALQRPLHRCTECSAATLQSDAENINDFNVVQRCRRCTPYRERVGRCNALSPSEEESQSGRVFHGRHPPASSIQPQWWAGARRTPNTPSDRQSRVTQQEIRK